MKEQLLLFFVPSVIGGRMEIYMKLKEKSGGRLIYQNALSCMEDVANFVLEGSAILSFPNGRLRLENKISAREGQKANYVLWCPEEFPSDILVEWDFWPIQEPGLCILFLAAKGRNGEDLFDNTLAERTGEYSMYHHGDINAFHISYYRRKEEEERSFHTCNLRKSYGFYLAAQGGDPLPDVADARGPYHMTVIKKGSNITFCINGLKIFSYEDDGVTYGPLLNGGKIGFRQMAPFVGEYADFKVWQLSTED